MKQRAEQSESWGPAKRRVLVLGLVVASLVVGCAKAGSDGASPTSTTSAGPTEEEYVAEVDDFVNLADMTAVRGFFISNPAGNLDEALAVANNPDGGTYPVGTIIQLVPQEAMVKRGGNFDAENNDWEFFELDTSAEGTVIHQRGKAEIESRFGVGSCSSCHALAGTKFDFVCEKDHGCDPLPIDDAGILAIQQGDDRPRQ